MKVVLMKSEDVQRVANILGPTSAAAKALAEKARRNKEGEDVVIYRTPNGALLVGPQA